MQYDDKFIFDDIGYNFIGSDLSAAFALSRLRQLNKNLNHRIQIFNELKSMLNTFSDYVSTFETTKDYKTGWLAFPILLKGKYSNKRREMQIKLEKSGIQTRTIFTGNITKTACC